MKKILAIMLVSASFILASYAETGAAKETTPPALGKPAEIAEAKVLKVFSALIDGAKFRAYLVKWKDAEIIVSDPFGSSDRKEGDIIKFAVQSMEMPDKGMAVRFSLIDFAGLRKLEPKSAPSEKTVQPEAGK